MKTQLIVSVERDLLTAVEIESRKRGITIERITDHCFREFLRQCQELNAKKETNEARN